MALKNDDLKEVRTALKKTLKGRPLYFGLMAPAGKKGKFLITKKKGDVKPSEFKNNYQPYEDAKENNLKGTACSGVCTGKDGVLTLHIKGKAPGAAVGFLEYFIQRQVKFKQVKEVKITEVDILPEVPELSKAELEKRLDALNIEFKKLDSKNEYYGRIEFALKTAKTQLGRDLDRSEQLLDEAEELLEQTTLPSTEPDVEQGTALTRTIDQNAVQKQLLEAKASMASLAPKYRGEVEQKLKEAAAQLKEGIAKRETDPELLQTAQETADEIDDMIDGGYQDFYLKWLKDLAALESKIEFDDRVHQALKATKAALRNRNWKDATALSQETEKRLKSLAGQKSMPEPTGGVDEDVLERLRTVIKTIGSRWSEGVEHDDLGQARASTDELESCLTAVRQAGVEHDDIGRGEKVLEHMRTSIRDTSQEIRVTKEELEQFRQRAHEEAQEKLEQETLAFETWRSSVQDGLDGGRYRKGNELKSGAYGTVSLFQSTSTNDPPLVIKQDKGGANEVDTEWEIYEKLGPHPNIARVLGKIEVDGESALVMESIEGGNANEAMKKARQALEGGKLTDLEFWGGIQHLIRGTLRGLAHMESKGLGHNDMKTLNIMINADSGETLLVDMGSARDIGETVGKGTPGFIPMNTGQKTGEKYDMFAVGGIAYASGTEKENPFYGKEGGHYYGAWMQMAKSAPPLSGDKHAKLSSAFKQFVRATYNPDPDKRPTFNEALEHPFIADPLLPENEAQAALKKIANL